MKKGILLLTFASGIALITLTSGQNGAGAESGFNATGSETGLGNVQGCSAPGASCHGSAGSPSADMTVALELDSAGIPVTHYRANKLYTVKITGTNYGSTTQPYFGFQVSCIKGTTAQTTPVNAGAFATTGLPTNVRYTAAHLAPTAYFVCNMIEHSNPIAATTLGGATGGTYVESFSWTAPSKGTGSISFWGALNAVNHDGSASTADHWNTTTLALDEWPADLSTAETENAVSIKAYPNPVTDQLNVETGNSSLASISIYGLNGRLIFNQRIAAGKQGPVSINTGGWLPGIYMATVKTSDETKTIAIVKQ